MSSVACALYSTLDCVCVVGVQCHHERFRLCQLQNGLKALPTLRPECFGSLQAKIEASHVHVVSSAASTVTSGCSVYIGVEDVFTHWWGGRKGKKTRSKLRVFITQCPFPSETVWRELLSSVSGEGSC